LRASLPASQIEPHLFTIKFCRLVTVLVTRHSRIVKRLRAIVTVLLVAVWLPASSHALLEYCELIHQVHTDHDADSSGSHEHDADNHDAADGHCALSSTHISVPLPDVVASLAFLCLLDFWTSELHTELQPSGLAPPGTAPPQLSHRWQFSFRTALPARAPTLIS
jgi:hypothetical protein